MVNAFVLYDRREGAAGFGIGPRFERIKREPADFTRFSSSTVRSERNY